jgi:putative membrane protein
VVVAGLVAVADLAAEVPVEIGDLWIKEYLSETEIAAVSKTVEVAEAKTSAEIVPMIVRRSTDSTLAGPVSLFIAGTASILSLEYLPLWGFLVSTVVVFLLAFWLKGYWPWIKWLEGQRLDQEVFKRAELEFYRQIYGRTKGNTGVLLFISVFERKVYVLTEKRIAEVHGNEVWASQVQLIISGIKNKKLGEALSSAILNCGEILQKDFPIRADDQNEISNQLIIKA